MSNSSTKNHNTNAKRDIDRNYNEASLQGGGSAGATYSHLRWKSWSTVSSLRSCKANLVESCKHSTHQSAYNGFKPVQSPWAMAPCEMVTSHVSIDIATERPRIQEYLSRRSETPLKPVPSSGPLPRHPASGAHHQAVVSERGLNEPFNGGLTTYGLVLMITHILRRHERRHHATEVDRYNPNLGCILVAFLQYYGNEFDPVKCGITC